MKRSANLAARSTYVFGIVWWTAFRLTARSSWTCKISGKNGQPWHCLSICPDCPVKLSEPNCFLQKLDSTSPSWQNQEDVSGRHRSAMSHLRSARFRWRERNGRCVSPQWQGQQSKAHIVLPTTMWRQSGHWQCEHGICCSSNLARAHTHTHTHASLNHTCSKL